MFSIQAAFYFQSFSGPFDEGTLSLPFFVLLRPHPRANAKPMGRSEGMRIIRGVNMSALSLADTTGFGIRRLIVNDPAGSPPASRPSPQSRSLWSICTPSWATVSPSWPRSFPLPARGPLAAGGLFVSPLGELFLVWRSAQRARPKFVQLFSWWGVQNRPRLTGVSSMVRRDFFLLSPTFPQPRSAVTPGHRWVPPVQIWPGGGVILDPQNKIIE